MIRRATPDSSAEAESSGERGTLVVGGILSICLSAVGSVTSWSVVHAGGPDGAPYLVVNAGLGVLGLGLLFLAWRRRRHASDRARTR